MSTTKHTPGPWDYALHTTEGVETYPALVMKDDETTRESIIIASLDHGSADEQDANARLIAAAPDMYEALTWALAEIEGRTEYQDAHQRERCMVRVRDALAKAEGQK